MIARQSDWCLSLDAFALFLHVHRTLVRGNMSFREASASSGISVAALHRMESRRTVTTPVMLAACIWMDANPFWFLVDPKTRRPIRAVPETRVEALRAFGIGERDQTVSATASRETPRETLFDRGDGVTGE